jgi:glycolate oxidase iron-sulfur subunit
MHVELHDRFADTPEGQAAKRLTSACVHCGFCLPACPTYVDGRDERDSPRGRIYLIKHFLETGEGGAETRVHLDRCLTCRNCETACPSGMAYGELLDIGRGLLEQSPPRPALSRMWRWLLRKVLVRPRLLGAALVPAQVLRPALPRRWRARIPPRQTARPVPRAQRERRMLLLEGCVQRATTPNTNAAARRVLDRLGITLVAVPTAGCCGALDYHLAAHAEGLDRMRDNIDAWWPHIEQGAEAIISSATGCGAQLADYGRLLADDPGYADKARRVSQLSRDLAEVLLDADLSALALHDAAGKIAVHAPCTLRNALGQPDLIHRVLARAGFELTDNTGNTLCCGSAGSYSILQPDTSARLREQTLRALAGQQPRVIATANVGCQLHLQAGSDVRVVHWIELLDDGIIGTT